MKHSLTIALLAGMMNTAVAHAEGGMGSGGGAGLVCFTDAALAAKYGAEGIIPDEALDSITSIKAIDLIYAESSGQIDGSPHPVINPGTQSFEAIFNALVERIDLAIPVFGGKVFWAYKRLTDNLVMRKFPIPRRDDLNDVVRYQGGNCMVATLALQETQTNVLNITPVPISLDIDARLFLHPKHSQLSRAAILLHESVYVIARENGEENSRTTRRVLRELLSEGGAPLTTILELLREYRFIPEGLYDTGVYIGPMTTVYRAYASYLGLCKTELKRLGTKRPKTRLETDKLIREMNSIVEKNAARLENHYFGDRFFGNLEVSDSEKIALARVARHAVDAVILGLKNTRRLSFDILSEGAPPPEFFKYYYGDHRAIETYKVLLVSFHALGGADGVFDITKLNLQKLAL